MKMRKAVGLGLVLGALVVAAACAAKTRAPASPAKNAKESATSHLAPTAGSKVEGDAFFQRKGDAITLRLSVSGASPGVHAAHIHEKGDCGAPDASSAGGHWNPTVKDHGRWARDPFHLGDLGNIEVGADGTGSLELTTDLWALGTGEPNDVVGKSVIIHTAADDFTTQPTGNAGGRVACGVIH
jgi:Cu-Zn family superoxide dismutase